MTSRHWGFTLIEILIAVAIVSILSAVVLIAVLPARKSASDARRKAEVAQIGRFLAAACYVPDAGEGDYDLATFLEEVRAKYPQANNLLAQTPRDPSRGTAAESFYRYIVQANPKKCALYANLENADEKITLPGLSTPTAGGGTGVLAATENGWNGTNKYFQFSN